MRAVEAVERWLLRVERVALVAALTVMVLVNLGLILSRPFPAIRLGSYFDLMVGLMPWVAMIGMAVGVEGGRHIGFVAFANALPSAGRKVALMISAGAMAAFFCVLIWGGVALVRTQMGMGLSTPAMNIPAWLFSLSVPVGGLLALFHLVLRLRRAYGADAEALGQLEDGVGA